MPYCEVGHYKRIYQQRNDPRLVVQTETEPVTIFYQLYGHGDIKVLLIIGLAGTHDAWGPQILRLAGTLTPNEEEEKGTENAKDHCIDGQSSVDVLPESQGRRSDFEGNDREEVSGTGIQVCSFDNRGVGKSSVPEKKSEYTTTTMAMDALAIMDHLGWKNAHVFGHSMGAMISFKLAAIVPHRIASLALISVTGGGYQCLPKVDSRFISVAYRFIKAKTPEERAHVDLDTHYTEDFLDADVGGVSRRTLLYKEYVKNITASGMQSKHGLNGQVNACWTHRLMPDELQKIRLSGILTSVIHGRSDIVAQVRYARAIAKKLHPVARLLELPAAHLVTHQNTSEVNEELLELIKATQSHLSPLEWSKHSDTSDESTWTFLRIRRSVMAYQTENEEESCSCFTFLISFCRWLIPEGCFTFFQRSWFCSEKQKE